jgi:nitrate/nitrite transporter NarK
VIFAAIPSRTDGLRAVILLYSGCALSVGALTWRFIPAGWGAGEAPAAGVGPRPWRQVLAMRVVWLQAVILLTAYMGYWGTFALSKLAVDGYGASDALGSAVSISAVGWRGVMAVGAGLVADRLGASRTVLGAFALLGLACLVFSVGPMGPDHRWLLWANAALLGAATYALRGVYFALLEESRVPMDATGRTVGVLSVIGYTPDIFVPPLKGWLLDGLPGTAGHRALFAVLAVAAVVGALATVALRRAIRPGIQSRGPGPR